MVTWANDEHVAVKDGEHDNSCKKDEINAITRDESESLSDIDDREVVGYLHSEEEKHYKKIIWENMNRRFLEEQAAKEAAAAVAKSRKEMKQKRSLEAKNSGPAQSAVEGTRQMLKTKRLSSKVNYDRLEKLFDEPVAPENPKKVRFEVPSDNHDNSESKLEEKMKDDELGSAEEFEDGDMGGEYGNALYHENIDEAFDYQDDGYEDEDDGWL